MDKIADGYYFMFEIGWFVDLLIPTLVKVKDGNLYLVGSKPCDCKNLKPCCIPAGGEAECKQLSLDDPSLKAFKSIDSLVAINKLDDLERELDKCIVDQTIQERYFNSPAKKQREAMIDRVMNDYQILSAIDKTAD